MPLVWVTTRCLSRRVGEGGAQEEDQLFSEILNGFLSTPKSAIFKEDSSKYKILRSLSQCRKSRLTLARASEIQNKIGDNHEFSRNN